ncbi:TPA: hypothetical protein QCI16_004455 [Enterobacter ludwigii]|nr:hypothetical protein [Enterobacter ludwigii]HDR2600233.1 hypothetical protein [Enterobacter ludwigii]
MKRVVITLFIAASMAPVSSMAALKCGGYYLKTDKEGWILINGAKPESQKITFLKQQDDYDNVKVQMMIPDQESGRWVGMDLLVRDKKSILNVEAIRMNMDEPRVFGTYDCVKAK